MAHDIITKFAKELAVVDVVHQCTSPAEALVYLSNNKIDLIFLDINMPLMSGIELIKALNHKPSIIVTTAYEEYAVKSFELDVVDYLVKPFTFNRFVQAVTKVLKVNNASDSFSQDTNENLQLNLGISKEPAPEYIFIKVDRKHVQISLANVYCFEAYGNYVKVWSEDSNLLTPRTLTSFEDSLPKQEFTRISKSVIIQKKHIHFIDGNELKLTNGMVFPIGKSFRQNLSPFTEL